MVLEEKAAFYTLQGSEAFLNLMLGEVGTHAMDHPHPMPLLAHLLSRLQDP